MRLWTVAVATGEGAGGDLRGGAECCLPAGMPAFPVADAGVEGATAAVGADGGAMAAGWAVLRTSDWRPPGFLPADGDAENRR